MLATSAQDLLEILVDSWDRNNRILVNLLRVVPEHGLAAKATEDTPSVVQMFTHIHYVRLVFLEEDAPEFAKPVPQAEWADDIHGDRIAEMLNDSAEAVRLAIKGKIEAGESMQLHYDNPILMLQHLIWHEGYHHGQIKLALKIAGLAIPDKEAGPLTWGIWMQKS